jgi:predicted TIM-barrel fold metal-dependent hydrolase
MRGATWQELDAALAAHPDPFIGFGTVRLDLPPEEIAEYIDLEVVGRGLRGIGELTPSPDRAAILEPVFRASADHGGLPVVVHGFAPTTAADRPGITVRAVGTSVR